MNETPEHTDKIVHMISQLLLTRKSVQRSHELGSWFARRGITSSRLVGKLDKAIAALLDRRLVTKKQLDEARKIVDFKERSMPFLGSPASEIVYAYANDAHDRDDSKSSRLNNSLNINTKYGVISLVCEEENPENSFIVIEGTKEKGRRIFYKYALSVDADGRSRVSIQVVDTVDILAYKKLTQDLLKNQAMVGKSWQISALAAEALHDDIEKLSIYPENILILVEDPLAFHWSRTMLETVLQDKKRVPCSFETLNASVPSPQDSFLEVGSRRLYS